MSSPPSPSWLEGQPSPHLTATRTDKRVRACAGNHTRGGTTGDIHVGFSKVGMIQDTRKASLQTQVDMFIDPERFKEPGVQCVLTWTDNRAIAGAAETSVCRDSKCRRIKPAG